MSNQILNFMSNKIYLKKSFAMLIAALFMCVGAFAQQAKLSGSVVDSQTKETLPGVTISVKGTKILAITDMNGKIVYTEQLGTSTEKLSKEIDLSKNAKGMYNVEVDKGGNVIVKRISVE